MGCDKDNRDRREKAMQAEPAFVYRDTTLTMRPPFPQRLKKKNDEGQFKKFLNVLKQLHINILLVEALEQMPSYVKFLKDILFKEEAQGV